MEYTTENYVWALEQIKRLSIFRRKGFPETDSEKDTITRAFMKILQDQPGNDFTEDKGQELGVVRVVIPPVTARTSGEQLIEAVIDNCEWFPLPVEFRKIYHEFLNFNTGGEK